jgi:hypothetical protein
VVVDAGGGKAAENRGDGVREDEDDSVDWSCLGWPASTESKRKRKSEPPWWWRGIYTNGL